MSLFIYTTHPGTKSQKYHVRSKLGEPKCRALLTPLDTMCVSDSPPEGLQPCRRCFPEAQPMPREISQFKGEYRWLSNFWNSPMVIDGEVWPTVEHYYVAHKTLDLGLRESIRLTESPGEVKRLGRTLQIRPDWESVRLSVMRKAVRSKFIQSSHLTQKLLSTGDLRLVEGNTWGDTFWGVCNGVGENWLGRILMEVRGELGEPLELDEIENALEVVKEGDLPFDWRPLIVPNPGVEVVDVKVLDRDEGSGTITYQIVLRTAIVLKQDT